VREGVKKLWPVLKWIHRPDLREKVARTWELALERSRFTADDLNRIPFTLLVPNCPTTFMPHKKKGLTGYALNPYATKVAGGE